MEICKCKEIFKGCAQILNTLLLSQKRAEWIIQVSLMLVSSQTTYPRDIRRKLYCTLHQVLTRTALYTLSKQHPRHLNLLYGLSNSKNCKNHIVAIGEKDGIFFTLFTLLLSLPHSFNFFNVPVKTKSSLISIWDNLLFIKPPHPGRFKARPGCVIKTGSYFSAPLALLRSFYF